MPEIRECLAFYLIAIAWFRRAQEDEVSLQVIRLHADAADSNRSETILTQGGLPYVLENTSTVMRGNSGHQYALFPPALARTAANPNPPSLSTYHLFAIDRTMRSLILGFKQNNEDGGRVLYAKVAYLTHTCLQIYTAAQWEVMRTTPKSSSQKKTELGRARIGLGIELSTHTIAFITLDNLFEVAWKESKEELPKLYVGVDDYPAFLEAVVEWLKARPNRGRYTRFARDAIQDSQDTFHGVGVYTVNELFFDAGIPPFISEAELTDCPSRMARLCEALWSYAHVSTLNLPKLLSPAMAQGVLAPTKEHRRRYVHWLHVHARDYCRMPVRMAELLEDFNSILRDHVGDIEWFRLHEKRLYDIFDPYYIRFALFPPKDLAESKPTLGHLIFPLEDHASILGNFEKPTDPLTVHFEENGKYGAAPTLLKPGHYIEEGIVGAAHRNRVKRPVHAYRVGKQAWSGTPDYGSNCKFSPQNPGPDSSKIATLTGPLRESKLFLNIIEQKKQVAVGPLEYSANASQAMSTHGVKMVHPLRGADYHQTLSFHRAATSSTSSLIVFPDNGDEDDDDDQTSTFNFHTDPPSPSSSNYPPTDVDYTSSSAYDSYLSDTDALFAHPIPSTSTSISPPQVDHSLRSPPRKKTKVNYRYKSRTYTNTNKSTLLEANSILQDFTELANPLDSEPDDEAPPLKRKRSSRNTTANYCFSARGNAMDPNREKPKPKRRDKSKGATSSEGG